MSTTIAQGLTQHRDLALEVGSGESPLPSQPWIAEVVGHLPALCRLDQASQALGGRSRRTLERDIDAGRLQAVRLGGPKGRVLIPRSSIERFLVKCSTT